MIKKIPTVTIGIPAYNEELGINNLLAQLSMQSFSKTKLVKIIIYSDGSTDKTVEVARRFKQLPLTIIDQKKRQGKVTALNMIIKRVSSDVLVLLDADVVLKNNNTINQLSSRLYKGGFDLCAPRVVPLKSHSGIGDFLMSSLVFKNQLFESINSGNNIYTCHGRSRAFSKRLYSQIIFKDIDEDAYSYLFCKYYNYRYQYLSDLAVFYHLPINLPDHALQSTRFFQSKQRSYAEFGEDYVKTAYYIPRWLLIKTLLISITKNRMLIPYIFLTLYLSLKARFIKRISNTWIISKSSKNYNLHNIKDKI